MKNVRKMIIAFVAFVMVVFYGGFTCPAYAAEYAGTAEIKADSLNVRSGPGKEYDAMGKVYEGNQVNVLAVEGEWLKIEYHSSEGYIALEYTEYEPNETEEIIDETEENAAAVVEENETEDEPVINYKLIFGLVGAIVILLIVILVTIKSIKNMDEYGDMDEDEDDEYEDDEYDEDEYDEDEYDEEDEAEDEEEEYEYVMVRRPKQKTQPAKRLDDYTIDIDPSYFE